MVFPNKMKTHFFKKFEISRSKRLEKSTKMDVYDLDFQEPLKQERSVIFMAYYLKRLILVANLYGRLFLSMQWRLFIILRF